jgi:hypothetical protein
VFEVWWKITEEMNMKRILFLLLLNFSSISYSQSLPPLREMLNKTGLNDVSSYSYFGTRCATLFSVLSNYMRDNGNTSDTGTVNALRYKSDVFRKIALSLDIQQKKSSENIEFQNRYFFETYAEFISKNKQIYNNALEGQVGSDASVCNQIYPAFEKNSFK